MKRRRRIIPLNRPESWSWVKRHFFHKKSSIASSDQSSWSIQLIRAMKWWISIRHKMSSKSWDHPCLWRQCANTLKPSLKEIRVSKWLSRKKKISRKRKRWQTQIHLPSLSYQSTLRSAFGNSKLSKSSRHNHLWQWKVKSQISLPRRMMNFHCKSRAARNWKSTGVSKLALLHGLTKLSHLITSRKATNLKRKDPWLLKTKRQSSCANSKKMWPISSTHK